jgi:membrane protease YdiL (CAAX protease family)
MKPENNAWRAFIDLAEMGRTDWRSIALTIVLVVSLSIPANLTAALVQIVFLHRFVSISDVFKAAVFHVAIVVACILALRLICRKILRRPFRSLISTDLTFKIRRCLLGAALCLPAQVGSLVIFSLYFSMRTGSVLLRHFEWPHDIAQIEATIPMIILIPFLAFIEELFFRAWLTQTLGHYIRSTIIVVALVAVLFAAIHTQYNFWQKMQVLVDSLGLSALSLRDRRLELAIGAHSMMNVCVTLQALFLTGPLPFVDHAITTTLDLWSIAILRGAIPYALLYGLAQITGAWFVPAEAHLTLPGEVQPG